MVELMVAQEHGGLACPKTAQRTWLPASAQPEKFASVGTVVHTWQVILV